jgi:hypothetical protein
MKLQGTFHHRVPVLTPLLIRLRFYLRCRLPVANKTAAGGKLPATGSVGLLLLDLTERTDRRPFIKGGLAGCGGLQDRVLPFCNRAPNPFVSQELFGCHARVGIFAKALAQEIVEGWRKVFGQRRTRVLYNVEQGYHGC